MYAILPLRSSNAGIIAFAIIDVLFSRVLNLWLVSSTFAVTILSALLNDYALFASTSAFIPLIKVLPIAAPACNIATTGIVLFSFEPKCSCPFVPVVVAGPFDVWIIFLVKEPVGSH